MLLECLACGVQIQDKAFVAMVENQNPFISEDELMSELKRDYPNFACYSCDLDSNKLVPADQCSKLKKLRKESKKQFRQDLSEAYSQIARTCQSMDARQYFNAEAENLNKEGGSYSN